VGFTLSTEHNLRKKRTKKEKKVRNRGFLRENLKNGVVGDSINGDFIGLICF
jgi:hypothetical protein